MKKRTLILPLLLSLSIFNSIGKSIPLLLAIFISIAYFYLIFITIKQLK